MLASALAAVSAAPVAIDFASGQGHSGGVSRALQSNSTVCAPGFHGPRCLSCTDSFFPKLVHSGSFQLECEACPATGTAYLQLLGGMLLGGAGILYMCYIAIKYALVRDSAFAPLAKVAVGFLQTVSLARFLPLVWTPGLAGLWAATDGMASVSTYLGGAHCLGWDETSGWRATAGAQLLVPLVIVLPVTLAVLAVARAACAGACSAAKAPVQPTPATMGHVGQWITSQSPQNYEDDKAAPPAQGSTAAAPPSTAADAPKASADSLIAGHAYQSTFADNAIACCVVIAFSMYVTLAATAYSFMACLRIGGERSLIADPNFLCNGDHGDWMTGVGMPAFLLYAIGIPAVFGFLLYRNKNTLDSPQTLHRYGFLYGSYKDAAWYWPMTVHIRKLLVVVFITAIAPCGVGIQSMSIVLDLGIANIAHDRSKPFRLPLLNLLESLSLLFSAVALTASTAVEEGAAVKGDIRVQTTGWIAGQTAIFTLALLGLLSWAHLKLEHGVGASGSLLGPEAPLVPPKPPSAQGKGAETTSVVPTPVQQQA